MCWRTLVMNQRYLVKGHGDGEVLSSLLSWATRVEEVRDAGWGYRKTCRTHVAPEYTTNLLFVVGHQVFSSLSAGYPRWVLCENQMWQDRSEHVVTIKEKNTKHSNLGTRREYFVLPRFLLCTGLALLTVHQHSVRHTLQLPLDICTKFVTSVAIIPHSFMFLYAVSWVIEQQLESWIDWPLQLWNDLGESNHDSLRGSYNVVD